MKDTSYVKVNYFKHRRSFSECNFPSSIEDNWFDAGWQRIVQLDVSEWIPSYLFKGLAFIAFEDDEEAFDDCKGMCHFYVAKYRIESAAGVVSIIPKHACPPFAGQIDNFCKLWSVNFCQMVFKRTCNNSIKTSPSQEKRARPSRLSCSYNCFRYKSKTSASGPSSPSLALMGTPLS